MYFIKLCVGKESNTVSKFSTVQTFTISFHINFKITIVFFVAQTYLFYTSAEKGSLCLFQIILKEKKVFFKPINQRVYSFIFCDDLRTTCASKV